MKYDVLGECVELDVLQPVFHLMKSGSKVCPNTRIRDEREEFGDSLDLSEVREKVAPEIIGDNAYFKALRTSNSKDFSLGMEFRTHLMEKFLDGN